MSASLPPATAIWNDWVSAVLIALGGALAGAWLALDLREPIPGDPISLKPLKSLASLSIHVATLAWIGLL